MSCKSMFIYSVTSIYGDLVFTHRILLSTAFHYGGVVLPFLSWGCGTSMLETIDWDEVRHTEAGYAQG